ncbi:MAG: histidinol-phosphatase [Dehalococcoidia bacterium]
MTDPWKFSLHGGHSGDFCLHGSDTLKEVVEAAIKFGYSTFGVTPHAPRSSGQFLYPEEVDAGYQPLDLMRDFEACVAAARELATEYAEDIEILVGAEIEMVPADAYVDEVAVLRKQFDLDYVVGSIHWVDDVPIDVTQPLFDAAVNGRGGLERFLIRYYELVAEMSSTIKPEVVGHLDLPKLMSRTHVLNAGLALPSVLVDSINSALLAIKTAGSIVEVNTRSIAKGLPEPYPSNWLVSRAHEMGIPVGFSDDSHAASQVGENFEAGVNQLQSLGITAVKKLTRSAGELTRQTVSLPTPNSV